MLVPFIGFQVILFLTLLQPPQFDTSTQLIYPATTLFQKVAQKLITWDNVYFLNTAHRGIQYEHENAFSWAWSWIVKAVAQAVSPTPDIGELAVVAALLAIISHLVACYFIRWYGLSLGSPSPRISQLAGLLYIISPAGIFLSVGYTESPFAALSFLGLHLFYTESFVPAGIVFAAASFLRSNGLLWGILYAVYLFDHLWSVLSTKRSLNIGRVARLIIGGSLIGLAFASPQYLAWKDHCPGRPWCDSTLPLFYGYIQDKYWNVGFLKYWTPNNIPNFAFATPTLLLLVLSLPKAKRGLYQVQLALIIGALFFWHTQIVTRVASCLPTPYLYVAEQLHKRSREGKLWVGYFLVWALTQAVLFGAFLPPA